MNSETSTQCIEEGLKKKTYSYLEKRNGQS